MIKQHTWRLVFFCLLTTLIASVASAQRGDDADRASKNGETSGQVAGVDVEIQYGRPNVKGRTIWGGLVPYGKIWRTGANEATTIEFANDVKIEGQPLAAGRYALFTIPEADSWTVIFNSQPDQWGAFKHDESADVLRVTVTPTATEHVESMDFIIDDSAIVLRWGELAVPIEITGG